MPDIQIPARAYRAGTITAVRTDGENDDRLVTLSFSSEEPVERSYGLEVLGHRDGEIDLSWIGSGRAPLLKDHRADVDHQVGVVSSVDISDGRGKATVRFGKHPKADEILARVRDREITAVSVGYRIVRMEPNGSVGGVQAYRATRWFPFEITLTSVPADFGVGVGRSDDGETITIPVSETRHMPHPNPNPEPTPSPASPQAPATPQVPETRAAPVIPPAPAAPVQAGPSLEETRKAEVARIKEINAIGRQFELPSDAIEKALHGDTTVEAFQRMALDHIGSQQAEDQRANATQIGMSEKDVKEFSFMRALRFLTDPTNKRYADEAGFEREVSETAQATLKREAQGILIPSDVLAHRNFADVTNHPAFAAMVAQRNQLVGTPASGGNLVATDHLAGAFIPLLRNKTALNQLGVRTLSGLVGNIDIPRQTGAGTAYWVGEAGEPTGSTLTFDKVAMTPHTLAAQVPMSRRTLLQTTPDIENLVRGDIIQIMALEMDNVGINGSADADAPDGLEDQAGVNTVTIATAASPTYPEIVDFETQVATQNADVGAMSYGFNAAMRGTLKTTFIDPGSGKRIMEGGEVNGYRAVVSQQFAANSIWFGNWSDFIIGLWSGLDLSVDTAANAASGGIVIRAFQDMDFAVRHAQSFAKPA